MSLNLREESASTCTTDAQDTVAGSYPVESATVLCMTLRVWASDGVFAAGWSCEACVKFFEEAPVVVGMRADRLYADIGAEAWDVDIRLEGSCVEIHVTGQDGASIQWLIVGTISTLRMQQNEEAV